MPKMDLAEVERFGNEQAGEYTQPVRRGTSAAVKEKGSGDGVLSLQMVLTGLILAAFLVTRYLFLPFYLTVREEYQAFTSAPTVLEEVEKIIENLKLGSSGQDD